ncbi:Leucine rich repeat protein, partial [Spraguea lophii 42_110]
KTLTFMNFLLIFLTVLTNCTEYEITHNNYDSIKELIPNANELGLYDEIIKNPYFSCFFEINENEYDNNKEIKIIQLDNLEIGSCNNIFPAILCEISDIKRLILSNLKLSRLPTQFENFKKLEELYLSYNEFKEFPRVLFSLSKLRILYLNDNDFETISFEIIQMTNLETLSLQDCYSLINISPNLFKLENLKELNLSHNPLLSKNNDFISCSVYSNDETSTENENNDYIDFVSYESLKKIYIIDNDLSTFPRILSNFINLEELDISNNLFEEIPYAIYSFTNLKVLNISYNRIGKIILKNGVFNNLLKLHLDYNRITELSIS